MRFSALAGTRTEKEPPCLRAWRDGHCRSDRIDAAGIASASNPAIHRLARKLHERLLIDLSWNSSRLEGNTYSLLDTQRLIEFGEAAEGNDARETQMILNHKAAHRAVGREGRPRRIQSLHRVARPTCTPAISPAHVFRQRSTRAWKAGWR